MAERLIGVMITGTDMISEPKRELSDKSISIIYKYIDGAHFFTSNDDHAAGLCVASTNLLTAFNEVAVQLKMLYEHNHGIQTEFITPIPFEVFERYVEAAINGAEPYVKEGSIVPSSIQPWMLNDGKAV